MKKILILFLNFGIFIILSAQQDFIPTNYEFTKLELNPAYAGSREGLSITHLYRNHWVGFKGSPFTFYNSIHTPIYKRILGLGYSIDVDRIGSIMKISSFHDFSGRIKLSKENKHILSFGLKVGVDLLSIEKKIIGVRGNIDPEFARNYQNKVMPNVGFGLMYEQSNFYVGFSIPKIIENYFEDNIQGQYTYRFAKQNRRYIFNSGAVFNLSKSKKFQFMPSVLTMLEEGYKVNSDEKTINFIEQKFILKFKFFQRFWFSPAYSFNWRKNASNYATDWIYHSLNFAAGVKFANRIELAYSIDYNVLLNNQYQYNGGSHEFLLRYDIIFKRDRDMNNPRYF